ncbi:mucin-2-like [Daphnia carinata]|uniref:mucin-2-like n=1 Tax=Daphnia carinata TaxID=120202 RepID=UPI00257F9E8C|nr:mucin-2-like [Daphnia carinata]
MASSARINSSTAKTLMVVWLMAVVVPSQQRPSEEASSVKPNSWIIQSPVKRPLPGLIGIGLPPGGILLMTMEPNATMDETQPQQQKQSSTALPSVPATEVTSESALVTEVSFVSQSPMTSTDVEEVAVTDTLSTSSIGTEAISEASNSPTLELETVTQEILSEETESPSDETPTTEPVTDAADVVVKQDGDAGPVMEALKVASEISQTTVQSIELTTIKEDEITTGSPVKLSEEASLPAEPSYDPHLIVEDEQQTDESDSNLITTTTEMATGDVVSDEDITTEADSTTASATEDSVPHSSEPTTPYRVIGDSYSDIYGDGEKDETPTAEPKDSTTSSTTTEPPTTISEKLSDEDVTSEEESAVTSGPSELLDSSTESGSGAGSDETSTDAGSGVILSTEVSDESNAHSGYGASSDAPLDVAADDSVPLDSEVTTDSSRSEAESPAVTEVAETEAHEFLVVTTEPIPEDPGLGDAVTEIENIDLGLESNTEGSSSSLIASPPAVAKNAGNSRSLLSKEEEVDVKAVEDVTEVAEKIADDLKKSGDEEARQYHRPYPIRYGMRPGGRPAFRPSIDRHDQNFRPEYEANDFNVISRTYDYCYTMWCKFKTTLSRIGLL